MSDLGITIYEDVFIQYNTIQINDNNANANAIAIANMFVYNVNELINTTCTTIIPSYCTYLDVFIRYLNTYYMSSSKYSIV